MGNYSDRPKWLRILLMPLYALMTIGVYLFFIFYFPYKYLIGEDAKETLVKWADKLKNK